MRTALIYHAGTDGIEVRSVDVFLESSRIFGGVRTHQTHQWRRSCGNRNLRLVVGLELEPKLTAQRRAFAVVLLSAIHVLIITVVSIIVIILHIAVVENHRFVWLRAVRETRSICQFGAGAGVLGCFTLGRPILFAGAAVFQSIRRTVRVIVIIGDAGNFCDGWGESARHRVGITIGTWRLRVIDKAHELVFGRQIIKMCLIDVEEKLGGGSAAEAAKRTSRVALDVTLLRVLQHLLVAES